MAKMQAQVFVKRVNTKDNIADLPSRGAWDEYFAIFPASMRVTTVLPAFASFTGPLQNLVAAFSNLMF